MKTSRLFISVFAMGTLLLPMSAYSQAEDETSIIQHITANGANEIVMPAGLAERLLPNSDIQVEEKKQNDNKPASGRMAGYRVQVFSDNNARTAKAEANAKARQIRNKFPQYQTHVMFTSPYWRLRIGDFKTRVEAEGAAAEIKTAFPTLSKEIRVVKDRVNIIAE
ncbi:MAG: SPOR domain-containing protein [Muribaculaceae bacterium]|nr:SPOR domain-containing protein [Muribaculaceae bacterium]